MSLRTAILPLILVPLLIGRVSATEAFIGIYADSEYSQCHEDVVLNESMTIYVAAFLGDEIPDGLTCAEFRIANWIGDPGFPLGTTTVTYPTDLYIGDLGTDIQLAFSSPQLGPVVRLATIEIQALDETWIGPDHAMVIDQGEICECLVICDGVFKHHDDRPRLPLGDHQDDSTRAIQIPPAPPSCIGWLGYLDMSGYAFGRQKWTP